MVMSYRPRTACSLFSTFSSSTAVPTNETPTITDQPDDVDIATPGTDATFTVAASGPGTLSYQWMVGTHDSFGYLAGENSTSLTLTAPTVAWNGRTYFCRVSNEAGYTDSDLATLTFSGGLSAPSFTQQPANTTVIELATATFSVLATGSPSAITYAWLRQRPGESEFTSIPIGEEQATPQLIAGIRTNRLQVFNCALIQTGTQFKCAATNSQGTTYSTSATMTVVEDTSGLNVTPAAAVVNIYGMIPSVAVTTTGGTLRRPNPPTTAGPYLIPSGSPAGLNNAIMVNGTAGSAVDTNLTTYADFKLDVFAPNIYAQSYWVFTGWASYTGFNAGTKPTIKVTISALALPQNGNVNGNVQPTAFWCELYDGTTLKDTFGTLSTSDFNQQTISHQLSFNPANLNTLTLRVKMKGACSSTDGSPIDTYYTVRLHDVHITDT